MLGVTCKKCGSELLTLAGYHDRKRITVGDFCPECLKFVRYGDKFNKMRDDIIEFNKKIRKHKTKFLKKLRKPCPNCLKNGKENRNKWKMRTIQKKKDKKPTKWKCTCQICGNVWYTNSGDQFFHYPKGYKEFEQLDERGL